MGTSIRSWILASGLSWFAFAAQAQEVAVDFAGEYRTSPRVTRVEVSTWGEHCGPRPLSVTEAGGARVEAKKQGVHLALAFPDRNVLTNACWSLNPTLRVTNTVATTARWRTECATPPGDAKRERGVYTVSAPTRDTLELVDESSYDWQLKDSHCVATVRTTQTLQRGPVTPPAPIEEAESEPSPAGCTPGPIARLRLRPADARIGPGERVCFSVRATDAQGCAMRLAPSDLKWSLIKPEAALGTLAGACFKAAGSAADAEGRFQVVVASGSVRAESAVSVVPADLSDITARRGMGANPGESAGVGSGITSALGIDAVVRGSSEGVLVAAFLALLLAMVALAWFVYARARQRARARARSVRPARRVGSASAASSLRPSNAPTSTPPSMPSGSTEQLICPRCRHGYPGGTLRCPRDGETPIRYAEFLRRAQAVEQAASTCPACGAQLAPGALFCGSCGAKVRA